MCIYIYNYIYSVYATSHVQLKPESWWTYNVCMCVAHHYHLNTWKQQTFHLSNLQSNISIYNLHVQKNYSALFIRFSRQTQQCVWHILPWMAKILKYISISPISIHVVRYMFGHIACMVFMTMSDHENIHLNIQKPIGESMYCIYIYISIMFHVNSPQVHIQISDPSPEKGTGITCLFQIFKSLKYILRQRTLTLSREVYLPRSRNAKK